MATAKKKQADRDELAKALGMKADEIADVNDSPAGTVIVTTDGVSMIDVPEDKPDAEGKTGLMFLVVPEHKGVFTFPVYASDELTDGDTGA